MLNILVRGANSTFRRNVRGAYAPLLIELIVPSAAMKSVQRISSFFRVAQLFFRKLRQAVVDIMPVVLVIAFFQAVIVRQPLPNVVDVMAGSVLVVLGLMLFVEGLELGLFPIGEAIASALIRKGSLFWLLLFSFFLGFSTTIAEPALIGIADEAARVAGAAQLIEETTEGLHRYAFGLRIAVAFSVGTAILLGVLRILKGWSLPRMVIGGYVLVMLITIFAPDEIIGIAYDAGGVTTSTITVPLVAALGVGLAGTIRGRNPLVDGFGLIAFASLMPMIFVMMYGMLLFY
jgi:hypothetical protein